MLETLLAKSCKDCGSNKYLLQHTKMVINFGMFVGNKIFNEHKIDNYNKVKENFLLVFDFSNILVHKLRKFNTCNR